MQKLFISSHLRTLQRLAIAEYAPNQFALLAANNHLAPSGQPMLYRLPREELKHVLNTQCPVNSLEETHAEAIITSSKRLRLHAKYDEAKICAKCPFVDKCKYARKPWESKEPSDSLHDLLNLFHGLQNHLKPENIFYRQWVSAYRLGDSIIASIDDLSKGGKEIEEYDRIRLESAKKHESRTSKQAKDGQSVDQKFQEVMAKVQKIEVPKPKVEKPQAQKEPKIKKLATEQAFGRDFSFDEQAQFEPKNKVTKKTFENREKPEKLSAQKGYQKIEEGQGRPPRQEWKQRQEYKSESKPYPNFVKKEYAQQFDRNQNQRYQGGRQGSRYGGRDSNNQDFGQRQYQKPQGDRQGNRYGGRDSYNKDFGQDKRSQGGFNQSSNRFDRDYTQGRQARDERPQGGFNQSNNRFDRDKSQARDDRRQGRDDRWQKSSQYQGGEGRGKFNQKYSNDQSEQEYPRIRQANKRTGYQGRNQESQHSFSKPPSVSSNPFVTKWNEPEQPFEKKPREEPKLSKEKPIQSSPRIIEVENIEEPEAPRRGRNVRPRRSSSSSKPQQE